MVVKPPPSKDNKNQKIEEFINKGANVIEENLKLVKDEWVLTSLRIPKSILNEIDSVRKNRIGITRNTWILETIQKELKDLKTKTE